VELSAADGGMENRTGAGSRELGDHQPGTAIALSATKLALLFLEAGGPPGVLNVVHGGGSGVGKALAPHMDVDKITMVYAGQSNMKRVTVETGGKSPQIITREVPDLDVAVQYAVAGIYTNKGEMCSAGSRLLVHDALHDPAVEEALYKSVSMRQFVGIDLGRETGGRRWWQRKWGISACVPRVSSRGPRREGSSVRQNGTAAVLGLDRSW
jgi:Aldehyde dehydrogenase family